MDKVNRGLASTVPGGSEAGSHNLSLIKSTTPGQVPANTVKPNDGRLAVRIRGDAKTGAATQGRDGYRTASPPPKVKGGPGQHNPRAVVHAMPMLPTVSLPSTPLMKRDWRIDATTASREITPAQMELDQTAAAVMARSNPITEYLNSAVKGFYQVAGGGLAARSNRFVMASSLAQVARLKSDLATLISDSAPFVAANSGDYPALSKWRQGLIKSLGSIDSWLKNAHAYAAGLTCPGGHHTVTPALVPPPSVILASSVSPRNATQEVKEIWKEFDRANKVITKT